MLQKLSKQIVQCGRFSVGRRIGTDTGNRYRVRDKRGICINIGKGVDVSMYKHRKRCRCIYVYI